MKNKPLVTICMHTGKLENYPLVENFLKSFLICNFYENIELMLIESSGNERLRNWFTNLNFDDYFVNFKGSKSNIKKRKEVSITKNVKFYDYSPDVLWFQCYTKSIQKAIDSASGKYFSFFAEDNQFTVAGNIIEDYIEILEKEGSDNSSIHFFANQGYKLAKKSNAIDPTPLVLNDSAIYFKAKQQKWDFWSLTKKTNFNKIGRLVESTKESPHITIDNYSERSKLLGYQRFYPLLPHGVWFYNVHREEICKQIINKTNNNPDCFAFNIKLKKDWLSMIDIKRPLTPATVESFLFVQ